MSHFSLLIPESQIHVDLMSILRRYVEKKVSINFRFPRHSDIVFLCNFDEWKISTYFFWRNFDERNIDVVLMYFFRLDFTGQKINIVSVYFLAQFREKTDVTHILIWIWKTKNWGRFDISFWYIKSESYFNDPFGLNIVLMYFFKVISFYLDIYQVIIQCLRIFTWAGIWSDLICFYLQRNNSPNIFWNISANL